MKSFNQHQKENPKKLEDVSINEATAGDLLIGLGMAGGLLALKKGWDTFGKGTKLQAKLHALNPFQTQKDKAAVAKDIEDKRTGDIGDAKGILGDPDASEKDKAKAQKTLDKKQTDDEKATDKIAAKTGDTTKKQTAADAELLDADRDSAGNLAKQPDAQKAKDMTGKAPPGWATSPEKSPGKGSVWSTKDQEKWDADAPKRAEKTGARAGHKKDASKAGQDVTKKSLKDLSPADIKKRLELAKKKKAERAAKEKAAKDQAAKAAQAAKDDDVGARLGFNTGPKGVETGSYMHTTGTELVEELLVEELTTIKSEFQRFVVNELLIDLTEKSRTELLEELVLEETMTLQESNELQAIMALDDVGIEAEINKKGQVVVKKKDLKKAEKALKKSFRKGGQPKLVGEEVELTEGLGKLDKSVIDAFYYKKEKAGKVVSTDGDSLEKNGIGGNTIAQWLDPSGKIAIGTQVDSKSTESILKYMKKSIPKGNFDKKSYKKFFGEEVERPRTAYEVVSEAREKLSENVDEHAANELYLFIKNDGQLYRQQTEPIIKNIVRKKKSGKYDHSKAPKLWMYLVDNGAKKYVKEFGGNMKVIFPKEVRQSVAVQFANEYNAEIDLGNYN